MTVVQDRGWCSHGLAGIERLRAEKGKIAGQAQSTMSCSVSEPPTGASAEQGVPGGERGLGTLDSSPNLSFHSV